MRLSTLALVLALFAHPIQAQPAPPRGPETGTILSLTEAAEREVTPDLLRARLTAEATADSAARAQAMVNAALEKAVAKAKAAGVQLTTGGYNTWEEQQRGPDGKLVGTARWRATGLFSIASKDNAKLLQTAGSLQSDGLLLQGLGFEISRELYRSLEDDLTREALARLKVRAELAATALGQRFNGWSQVRIGGGAVPQPRMMQMAMQAKAMAAPVAEPGTQTVSLTVEGDARLQ